jgi:predicted 3-demethylubiquinone-9 3-methyltransferase (glyoxalase superfamily)
MKSTIKQINEMDVGKQIEITKLFANQGVVDAHRSRLQMMFKSETPEQINAKLNNLIARDNAFNAAMSEIVKCFQIEINQEEFDNIFNDLKSKHPTHKEEFVKNFAKHSIVKELVFQKLIEL